MKKILYFSLAALFVTVVSCNRGVDPVIIPAGEPADVSLTLEIAPVSADGQSTADPRTSLNNVWLLAFDESGANILARKESRFDIGKPATVGIVAGKNLDLYVVANVDAGTIFQLGKMTCAEFRTAVNSTAMANADAIPFSGHLKTTIEKEGEDIAVSLTRIAARLAFKFAYSGEGYTVKSVTVKNVVKYPYYVSQGENTSWKPDAFKEIAMSPPFDQEYAMCISENLMGEKAGVSSYKDKVTDKLATCIEILAEKSSQTGRTVATFRYYPGGNATTDFNLKRNCEYKITETVDFSDASDKRITRVEKGLEREAPEANCYMIAPASPDELAIPVTRINKFWAGKDGDNNLDNTINDGSNGGKVLKWKARVIKSAGEGELIDFVKDSGESVLESIIIKASGTGSKGNVLIGIFDATAGEPAADAKPLWSWHIWVTDYVPGGLDDTSPVPVVQSNPGRTEVPGGAVVRFGAIDQDLSKDGETAAIMDRNLGALSADHRDGIATFGMFYQWGRKDPMFAEFDLADYDVTKSINSIPALTDLADAPVSLAFTVNNPLTLAVTDVSKGEWVNREALNTLWYDSASTSPEKTIYDPCPPGWRVPRTIGVFEGPKVADSEWTNDDSKNQLPVEQWGWYVMNESANCYIPLTGTISGSTGKIGSIGINTIFWTATAPANFNNAHVVRFIWKPYVVDYPDYHPDGMITYLWVEQKSGAKPIRCVKE